jgi:protein TonB
MKFGTGIGIVCAVVAHVGFLLFGGALFLDETEDHGTLQKVELLSSEEAEQPEEEEPEETPAETRPADELQVEEEPPPDSAEVVRDLELSAAASSTALEAASLGAIEAALSGVGGGGNFADALSFASGGRIGGLAKAGALDQKLEDAFTLDEIDQKPRVVFQSSPPYPAEMRGRNVEGLVSVIFVVDATGKVAGPRVESANHKAFEKPALAAVKQWKFEPAVKGGQRVSCKTRVQIRFPAS